MPAAQASFPMTFAVLSLAYGVASKSVLTLSPMTLPRYGSSRNARTPRSSSDWMSRSWFGKSQAGFMAEPMALCAPGKTTLLSRPRAQLDRAVARAATRHRPRPAAPADGSAGRPPRPRRRAPAAPRSGCRPGPWATGAPSSRARRSSSGRCGWASRRHPTRLRRIRIAPRGDRDDRQRGSRIDHAGKPGEADREQPPRFRQGTLAAAGHELPRLPADHARFGAVARHGDQRERRADDGHHDADGPERGEERHPQPVRRAGGAGIGNGRRQQQPARRHHQREDDADRRDPDAERQSGPAPRGGQDHGQDEAADAAEERQAPEPAEGLQRPEHPGRGADGRRRLVEFQHRSKRGRHPVRRLGADVRQRLLDEHAHVGNGEQDVLGGRGEHRLVGLDHRGPDQPAKRRRGDDPARHRHEDRPERREIGLLRDHDIGDPQRDELADARVREAGAHPVGERLVAQEDPAHVEHQEGDGQHEDACPTEQQR